MFQRNANNRLGCDHTEPRRMRVDSVTAILPRPLLRLLAKSAKAFCHAASLTSIAMIRKDKATEQGYDLIERWGESRKTGARAGDAGYLKKRRIGTCTAKWKHCYEERAWWLRSECRPVATQDLLKTISLAVCDQRTTTAPWVSGVS